MKTKPYLLIDAGNTRIKWLLYQSGQTDVFFDPSNVVSSGYLETVSVDGVPPLPLAQLHEGLQQVLLCSVLGPGYTDRLAQQLGNLGVGLYSLSASQPSRVRSLYENPASLGADRWAACLAVAGLQGPPHRLVVGFGTATTVDRLTLGPAGWVHEGGFIFPGCHTMLESLHRRTAQLPPAQAKQIGVPVNTLDAIGAGVVLAQQGAVELARKQFEADCPGPVGLYLSGGFSPVLADLWRDATRLEHAVFQGLWAGFSNRGNPEGVA